jgi:RimJ/RimL family protein N-acetyltransferase
MNTNIIKLKHLNSNLIFDISNMIKKCEEYDHTSYDIFMDNDYNCTDINCFFIYMEGNIITGFISIFIPSQDYINVYGCTLPEFRCHGIFSSLFSCLKAELRNNNLSTDALYFPINTMSNAYNNAVQYLLHRDYFPKNTEYMLTYDLLTNTEQFSQSEINQTLELEYEETSSESEYSLWLGNTYIGGCLIYFDNFNNSKDIYATIYQYGILDEYQGMGYGKSGLKLILASLKHNGVSKVILQVNGDNKKAYNLYRDCGFYISDSIVYYGRCCR